MIGVRPAYLASPFVTPLNTNVYINLLKALYSIPVIKTALIEFVYSVIGEIMPD